MFASIKLWKSTLGFSDFGAFFSNWMKIFKIYCKKTVILYEKFQKLPICMEKLSKFRFPKSRNQKIFVSVQNKN